MDSRTLSFISVCSGAGMLDVGVDLALGGALRAGLYVEREATACALLARQMAIGAIPPGAIWDNVHTLTRPRVRAYLRALTDGGPTDILLGGIPCQPWSVIGKRAGTGDERDLWPATLRAIEAYEPGLVWIENVAGIVSRPEGAWRIKTELESVGYRTAGGLFSSKELGANHERLRFFLLADRLGPRSQGGDGAGQSLSQKRSDAPGPARPRGGVLPRYAPGRNDYGAWAAVAGVDPARMPALESAVFRVADGLATRSERLHLIGNGVDPVVAAYAFVSLFSVLRE